MASPRIPLTFRVARPPDAKFIARLCKRAVGRSDYVLRILDETIAEKGLFLALTKGELVGMTNLDTSIDGSGWLSMARTDPKWRRKGVALSLQRNVIASARKKGIRTLRLWTLSTNVPSIRACTKGGFRPVCETAHVSSTIRVRGRAKRPHAINPRGIDLSTVLSESPYLAKMNGYLAYKWYFVKATRHLFERLRRKGELHWDGKSVFTMTRRGISFGEAYSSFNLLLGASGSLFRTVKEAAGPLSPVWLGSYLPYNRHLLRTAELNGFTRDSWAKHCIVFEKKI